MTYLLIFVFMSDPAIKAPLSTGVAEFNGLEACLNAAKEIRRQATATSSALPLVLCAAKGMPKSN
jgi:hypothetical protein